jgi:hypothetical protein
MLCCIALANTHLEPNRAQIWPPSSSMFYHWCPCCSINGGHGYFWKNHLLTSSFSPLKSKDILLRTESKVKVNHKTDGILTLVTGSGFLQVSTNWWYILLDLNLCHHSKGHCAHLWTLVFAVWDCQQWWLIDCWTAFLTKAFFQALGVKFGKFRLSSLREVSHPHSPTRGRNQQPKYGQVY